MFRTNYSPLSNGYFGIALPGRDALATGAA